jgi:hypothetical protein
MLEPMILPQLRWAGGRHRCHNSGGSHGAMQGERSRFPLGARKLKAEASADDCTKAIHRYSRAAEWRLGRVDPDEAQKE